IAIYVIDEEIKRVNTLAQSALDRRPLISGNDPGNDVERKDLLRARLIAIHVEGNSHAEQCLLRRLLAAAELGIADRRNALEQQTGIRPGCSVRIEHLIVETVGRISVKKHVRTRNAAQTASRAAVWSVDIHQMSAAPSTRGWDW